MAPAPRPLAERFWAKVERRGPDECWPWHGGRGGKSGLYGVVRLGGRGSPMTTAHRVAFMLTRGQIPEGHHVLHRCDNPPCCNPAQPLHRNERG